MEFRFRAAELRLPLSHLPIPPAAAALAEGCFPKQTLPAGSVGEAGNVSRATTMPPISLMDPFRRAIEKERIREEMYLRTMVERKILEEEVRMEMEMESLMATRRIQAGNPMVAVALERGHGEEGCFESGPDKAQPSNKEISETKRETTAAYASNKAPKHAQGLSCALCQVSATSEKVLNTHLAGKKHAAKLAALQKKSGAKMSVGSLCSNQKIALDVKEEAITNSTPNIMIFQINGKKHQVLRKGMSFLCECCNMKCSNISTMLSHLVGKKHNASAKLDRDTSQVKSGKDCSLAESTVGKCEMQIIEVDIAAASVVAKDNIAANVGENIERGDEPFENDSGKDLRPAEATTGTCSMSIIEKDILTAPAWAVKDDDIATNGEENIVQKGKEPCKNSTEMDTGEVQSSKNGIIGTKRKVATNSTSEKAPRLAQELSCAICQVNATSMKALCEHLQGRKHKNRVTVVGCTTDTMATVNGGSMPSYRKVAFDIEDGNTKNMPKVMNFHVNGKMHRVLKKGLSLWCEQCNEACDNSTMMLSHLIGKKHNALVEPENGSSPTKSDTYHSPSEQGF